jgi:diguanylate cyclase (GGDEF)-like protein
MGVWECTLPENTLVWSDGVYDIFGLPRGSGLERGRIASHYPQESLAELERVRSRAITEGSGFTFDAEIVTSAGQHRWIRITATVETDAGAVTRIFGTKQDITEEKLALDRIRYLAAHDVMTGLANRATFQERLSALTHQEMLARSPLCLVLIDLDGFKTLNDSFGHAVGDDCLRETARRLKDLFGDTSLIARIGGDEFAVVVECRRETRPIPLLGHLLVQALKRTVAFGDIAVEIGASVGMAFADGSGAESLVKNADVALYAAKAAGRGQYTIFNPPAHQPRRETSAA